MIGAGVSLSEHESSPAKSEAFDPLLAAVASFKSIVENSPFGIYAVDADFKLALVSKGAQKVFEKVRPLIGRDFAEVLRVVWPEPFANEAIAIFRHTLATGDPYHAPTTVGRRADTGNVESYDWKTERLTLPDGRLGVICHFYDLSERNHYEAILRESAETLKLGVSVAGFGLGKIDYITNTITLNEVAAELFQFPPHTPIARSALHARFHPDDEVGVLETIASALDPAGSGLLSVEHRIISANGAIRWVNVREQIAFETQDGVRVKPFSGLLAIREVTKDKVAQQLIQASDKLFRGTFENAAVGVAHVSTDGRWLNVNNKLCGILGYSREELTSTNFQAITYSDDLAVDLQHVREMLDGTIETYSMDKRYIRKDKSLVWTNLSVSLQRDESGNPDYFISVVRDITEHVRLTEALRVSRAHMNNAALTAKLSYAVVDVTNNEITASENHESVMGFATPGICKGSNLAYVTKIFLNHVIEADRQRVQEMLPAALSGERTAKIEYRVLGDDKKERWIHSEWMIEANQDVQLNKILTISIDITEQKRGEERFRQIMYEVNHRAKNLLSVVMAVARQTGKSGNPNTFLYRLSDRIAGLAASQDLLVLTEWKGILISDLVKAQLHGFSDQLGKRITMEGPQLQLLPAATQAIGMALHELATNASKYGSLSKLTGTLKISWHLSGVKHDLFCMTWRESGGPKVTPPTDYGFGQRVIIQMVQSTLNGTAEVDYHSTGLVWQIQSPVETTLA